MFFLGNRVVRISPALESIHSLRIILIINTTIMGN